MKIEVKPRALPCSLAECEPGYFLFNNSVCLKTEYMLQNHPAYAECFCESGEAFWGGTSKFPDRDNLQVTPLEIEVKP